MNTRFEDKITFFLAADWENEVYPISFAKKRKNNDLCPLFEKSR
jgi:hypothetical protein